MPHLYMVWNVGSVFGLIFWSLGGLVLALLGVLILAENIKHRIQRFFRFRK